MTDSRLCVGVGDYVQQDELVANIETDKVTIPVNCPEAGLLKTTFANPGDTVQVGADLFAIDTDAKAPKAVDTKAVDSKRVDSKTAKAADSKSTSRIAAMFEAPAPSAAMFETPAPSAAVFEAPAPSSYAPAATTTQSHAPSSSGALPRTETREKMTRMRLRIAERMKEAQNTAASLTTFNEVDMSALMALRSRLKDDFVETHGVKLGYMSAFVKAAARALCELPVVNARIDPTTHEVVHANYVDISVAVATPKGLVTPVLRGCEQKSFSAIEREIAEYGVKAREGRISLEDLSGGTFTISNGGVFGSMMGTPIINAPQSAILGMHAIKERPVVVDGRIEARPMMYLALTYDHRLIDGREAVTFLVRVKEQLEDPMRFLFDL